MRKRAFTLVELLIVVAIIAILAAIAVPNFLEAQVRSKVSRVKSDVRTMATALETYRLDHTAYPTYFQYMGGVAGDPSWTEGCVLTTPIAYITSIESVGVDPFSVRDAYPWNKFVYFETSWAEEWPQAIGTEFEPWYGVGASANTEWGLVSFGPDTYFHAWEGQQGGFPGANTDNERGKTIYDSSNGTMSWGDIPRWGP